MVFIMIFTPSLFLSPKPIVDLVAPASRKRPRTILIFILFAIAMAGAVATAKAYVTEGPSWASGTTVTFQLGLGNAGGTLSDGNTSWNTAAAPALGMWDQKIQRAQLVSVFFSTMRKPGIRIGVRCGLDLVGMPSAKSDASYCMSLDTRSGSVIRTKADNMLTR